MNRKTRDSLIIGLISLYLAFLPSGLSWFKNFEAYTWDWRVNTLADPEEASDEIVVILLDQKSLEWAEKENGISWPWPREIFAAILGYCHQSGAKAVGFDVLFTNPSIMGVEDDQSLASSIKNSGNFVLAVEGKDKNVGSSFQWPDDLSDNISKIENYSESKLISYNNVDMPVLEFAKNSRLISHVNAKPDADGVNRSALLLCQVGDKLLPSLGLATFLAGNPDTQVSNLGRTLKLSHRFIPLKEDGSAYLRFRGPSGSHQTYNAASIIQSFLLLQEGKEPTVPKDKLKDKYILFGYSAAGLHDQHNVSVSGKYPGVEVHATVIDNIINTDFFREAPSFFNYLIAMALTVVSAMIMLKSSSYFKQGFYIIVLLLTPSIIAFFLAHYDLKVSLLLPTVSVSTSLFLSVGYNYLIEGRQKRFIKFAFKHYLSTHVIDELIDNPDKLKLGGERREISIFFSDLQGFTSISEKLEPEVLIEVLNEYLSAMSDIILDERGTIDKYEGDAIIAFWNAPLNVKNHAVQCVKSALQCQKILAYMNPKLKEKAGTDLKMRIGIHTGPAVVGNMGASERFDYTMLGDSVNLAARLEGVNKQFGTFTIISEETKKQIGAAYPVRELARVEVVGRKEPVVVFEPMFEEEYETRKEYLDQFSEGLQLFYEEKLEEALKVFEDNAENDLPSEYYANKCRSLIESKSQAPGGIWVMTSK